MIGNLCSLSVTISLNMALYSCLQDHQCFLINSLKSYPSEQVPWEQMTLALENIVKFIPDVLNLHTTLHIHGNAFFHRMIDKIPSSHFPRDIEGILKSNYSIPLRYRHIWIRVENYDVQIINRGVEWFRCEDQCRLAATIYCNSEVRQGDILSVESVCACFVENHDDFDFLCYCLCHTRPCTHYLSGRIPHLSSCHCHSRL